MLIDDHGKTESVSSVSLEKCCILFSAISKEFILGSHRNLSSAMITIEEIDDFVEKGEEWIKGTNKHKSERGEYPTEREQEQLTETADRFAERNQRLWERLEVLERLIKMSSTEGNNTITFKFRTINVLKFYFYTNLKEFLFKYLDSHENPP